MLSSLSTALALILFVSPATAFVPGSAEKFGIASRSSRQNSALLRNMCICIDCSRVTNCAAYHFVESKHEQPHMTDSPTFEPSEGNPTIHVNIRSIRNDKDRQAEVARMWREHKAETARAAQAAAKQKPGDDGGPLYGETKYDLTPVTTYEYDVVACDDYVHEKGCWVKNMPQEIRDANPDFVPS